MAKPDKFAMRPDRFRQIGTCANCEEAIYTDLAWPKEVLDAPPVEAWRSRCCSAPVVRDV